MDRRPLYIYIINRGLSKTSLNFNWNPRSIYIIKPRNYAIVYNNF